MTLGIDSSKLDVKVDSENVKIHIPEAKVLSSKPDPDSITKDSYYYAKNSAIADADDQTKAYKKAEKEMEKTAANDTVLLAQAQQRVQSLLKDYRKYGYNVRKRVYDHMGYQRKSCEVGYGRIDRIVSFLRWLGTMYSLSHQFLCWVCITVW